MENSADWEQKNLINELTQGRELAKQLQLQLHLNLSSSHETRELLLHNILKSYEKALSMLKFNGTVAEPSPSGVGIGMSDSPRSLSGSPHSEDSDRDFKDHERNDNSRKRKSMPRWTQQVQVCPGTGLEGPLDDGYSWRKYGQKDILGAKYPRGYYRCSHRNVQGCLATKQVQRSDEDPTIFEITYRGRHTCTQGSLLTPASSSPEKQEPNTTMYLHQQQTIHQPQQNQQDSQEMLSSFRTGLKVITEDLESTRQQSPFPSFYFPSTSSIKAENYVPSPSLIDNNFMGNFSPSFISPVTSGSNYFPVSPTHMNRFGGNQNLHTSDQSDLTEIVSAATSATNSPTIGLEFPFGPTEFDPTFTFDNPGFFS
ncbi:hypothetical protein F0562_026702 [Nyssa sinensis]|uniref:WRKY domain-containing protein n=1 Tax=Nyssa sinensis TaxID=561372 RepID=A0A5J5BC95_9ASTE|nr:hypothetical protein F0562_026702 [Nyssa sinensis]